MNNRIFIGIPCYSKVDPEILEDFMRFAYHLGRRMPEYEFFLGIKTKSEQFRARNAIVDAALKSDCDWLLMLDDDMVINSFVTTVPTDDYGFLNKLIAHDKDICGILYWQRGGTCSPVLMTKIGETGYRFLRDSEIENKLQRVDVAGGGCLLIKTKIFDRLQYPYFGPEYQWGTDIQLCRIASEKGIEVWTDTSIEFGHLKNEKTIVTSRNRNQFQMEDTVPGENKKVFVSSDIYTRTMDDAMEYTDGTCDFNDIGMAIEVNRFMEERKDNKCDSGDWYRLYPEKRIARQLWFNTTSNTKKSATEFMLNSIDNKRSFNILDFGCGIGIPSFYLAEKGHKVTSMDIRGTGTFEFLKWRADKHKVPITFIESEGGPPSLSGKKYEVVIAMDSIEHIEDWKTTLSELANCLSDGGVFFCNNGVLSDDSHPEHYHLDNKEFISECMKNNLMPFNQITFVKKEKRNAENTNPV